MAHRFRINVFAAKSWVTLVVVVVVTVDSVAIVKVMCTLLRPTCVIGGQSAHSSFGTPLATPGPVHRLSGLLKIGSAATFTGYSGTEK
eukprot:2066421-Amphidinium_carterae.1